MSYAQYFFYSAVALWCLSGTVVQAQLLPDSVGYVATVGGDVMVSSRGQRNEAHLGQAVVEGMTLQTGATGSLAIVLNDGTELAFGPRSELILDVYRYAPESESFRLSASIAHGTLSIVTGAIARLDPQSISLRTPTGTVWVHAGHALLKVAE